MVDNKQTIDSAWLKLKDEDQKNKSDIRDNPYHDICNRITKTDRSIIIQKLSSADKQTIKFAFISIAKPGEFKVRSYQHHKDDVDVSDVDEDVLSRGIKYLPSLEAQTLLTRYQESVSEAVINEKADIVVVNELGFPATENKPMSEAISVTKKILKGNDCLIVAGSYHDYRTISNSGYLFYPSDKFHDGVGIAPYHKQISAMAAEEHICVPPIRKILTVEAFGFNIHVIICLDLLDYTIATSIVNRRQEAPSIILVPSYTENMDKMKHIANILSRVSSSIVAIVNAIIPNESQVRIFMCGQEIVKEEIETIVSPSGNLPDNPQNKYVINIYNLDREKHRVVYTHNRANLDEKLEFLYAKPRRISR